MRHLATGIGYVDLHFVGRAGIIATGVLHGPGGVALIDPGPESCLPVLRRSLADAGVQSSDLRAILLTHIHLDHAGATGTLVREHPAVAVFVSERGAPHLIEPSRLIMSAERLYGDQMRTLWGEIAPVPERNVRTLAGGERIAAGGRRFEVAYTPGHAVHHVGYFDGDSGIVFAGDAAGIRHGSSTFVMPPTPPPDIDLEAWATTIARIQAWQPDTVFVTHFGPYTDVRTHLQRLMDQLHGNARIVREGLDAGGSDDEQASRFSEELRRMLRRTMTEDEADRYEHAGRFEFNWQGLARYWRKKR